MLRYFISDLHLQVERPEITRALLHFLQEVAPGADELYLLGDIFEAWIGDDFDDPVLKQVTPAFTSLHSSGTQIYFIHGNRDFLLGAQGAKRLGAQIITPPFLLDLPQGRSVLVHGDELCTGDQEYQAFRAMVRSSEWQNAFLAKPLQARLEIAKQLRETSKASGAMKRSEIMDVTQSAVEQLFEESGAALIIHGHTHRPARHLYPQGERIVLGDWARHGWYLKSDDQTLELVEFYPR